MGFVITNFNILEANSGWTNSNEYSVFVSLLYISQGGASKFIIWSASHLKCCVLAPQGKSNRMLPQTSSKWSEVM